MLIECGEVVLRPHGTLVCIVGIVVSTYEQDEINQAYYAANAGPESTLVRRPNNPQMEAIQ